MLWLIALVSAITTAAIGLVGTGLLAGACVSWFRISSFEGKSGFFVVGLALVGGILGLLIGAITPFIAAATSERFTGWSACLLPWGIVVATLLIAAAACRLVADVPPRIDGRRIVMRIELRLSDRADGTPCPSPLEFAGSSWILLRSDLLGLRVSTNGATLRTDDARREDGAWIIAGELWPHTRRGRLTLEASLDGRALPPVASPIPGAPGREHLEWSEWISWPQGHATSTDGAIAYRVHIHVEPPPAPALSSEERERRRLAERAAEFEALEQTAPLSQLLSFAIDGRDEELAARALDAIARRSGAAEELARRSIDDDADEAATAMRVVKRLVERDGIPAPAAAEMLARAGADLARRIDRVNETPVEEDPSFLGACDASIRFSAWIDAARLARERGIVDRAPELEAILVRSRRRPESVALRQDICRVASYHMSQWTGATPHPDDPAPR